LTLKLKVAGVGSVPAAFSWNRRIGGEEMPWRFVRKAAARITSGRLESPAMAIGLEEICTAQIDLAPEAQEVGGGPFGHRRVLEIVGGTVRGERLHGMVLSGGADWLLIGTDGWARLNVRMQWRMEDGAVIYLSAQGVVDFNEKARGATEAGTQTAFADQYYRTLMRMESGAERYEWVNHAVFVTEGRISPGDTGRGIEARTLMVT
jgi:Protein of unknown function (DUF3237)